MPGNFNIDHIDSYVKQKRFEAISLQKPGYQIYFFGRANSTADVIPYLNGGGISTGAQRGPQGSGTILNLQSHDLTPNAYLTSQTNVGDVGSIQSIKINNSVNSQMGSTAEIVIVNPRGIDYFNKTIGTIGLGTTSQTDYDSSFGLPINLQRIGDGDTVVIRLTNAKTSPSKDTRFDCETVFRGVIKNIERTTSPTAGAHLVIQLGDFSEVLRSFTALPLGLFSTISFSATGRGLVTNLVKYANRLTTGSWGFLGSDVSQAFASTAEQAADNFLTQNGLNTSTTQNSAQDAINATNHKMYIPNFFYLEYSRQIPDISAPINSTQQNQLINADPNDIANGDAGQNNQSASGNQSANIYNQITTSAVNNAVNFLNANALLSQTPEDKQTISSYQVALQKSAVRNLNKTTAPTDVAQQASEGAEKYAWILSDLYLDRGLITFEHKKLWAVMTETAQRSMREVYFDFAPKLSSSAKYPYDTAKVSEYNQNTSLPDIHPNVGILKYRLSPCLLAYDENNNSEIFQFSINDDDIVEQSTNESSEEVFTAVFGFGSALTPAALGQTAKDIFLAQNKGLLAFAHSIDPNIEQRLGYRFMTDHDQKIQIPILMYLTSYAILMQCEMNMFSASVTVTGNPAYKPGSIIRLKDQRVDYYCTDVTHDWNINNGYITHLNLAYGHTSGILPSPLTGGNLSDTTASNEQCQLRSKALNQYINSKLNIGGVNVHCLIFAIWNYMTCGAPTNQAMVAVTPEAQNSIPKSSSYNDWITPYGWSNTTVETRNGNYASYGLGIPNNYVGPLVSTYIPIINNYIKQYGLDAYNVTPNLVMNIIAAESSFVADAKNGSDDGGIGWFQLTCSSNQVNSTEQLMTTTGRQIFQNEFGISVSDAIYNFDKACSAGLQLLAEKFKASAYTFKGNTGSAFLDGIGDYNGSVPSNHSPNFNYANQVLGSLQVQQILAGKTPSGAKQYYASSGLTCAPAGTGSTWPYPVYGPIGERLDTYKSRHSGTTSKDAKTTLNNFSSGMTEGVNYITSLLNKYQNQSLAGAGVNGSVGVYVDNNSLIDKVIGAWFSNDNLSSLKSNDQVYLQSAISGITTLYKTCQNCTGQTASPAVGQNLNQPLALQQISFRYPCDNPDVTALFGPPFC